MFSMMVEMALGKVGAISITFILSIVTVINNKKLENKDTFVCFVDAKKKTERLIRKIETAFGIS